MSAAMYYIASVAPEDINEQILKWKHFMKDHFGCTVALKSPAHITLIQPFWNKEELQPAMEACLGSFSITQTGFGISLNGFGCFKPRVIFVQVETSPALIRLQSGLEEYLAKQSSIPIEKTIKPFHPHLTIANRDLHKKDFQPAWEHFGYLSYEAHFDATGISLLKHNGKNWNISGSFPFGKNGSSVKC